MEENKDIIEEVTLEEDTGKVNISDEVVATIAGIAAMEIEGITGMTGGALGDLAEKLGAKKSPQRGVKVSVNPDGAVIDLYAVVKFGIRIPELAWEVQENVKNSVETMTGIDVLKVNVHIDGVSFDKEKPAKKADEKVEVKEEASKAPEEVIISEEIIEVSEEE